MSGTKSYPLTRPATPAAIRVRDTRYSVIRPPQNPDNTDIVTIPTPMPGRRERITDRPGRKS